MPTFAPLRSSSALVATVVPCTTSPVSARRPPRSVPSSVASSARPSITPIEGSAGVEVDLASVTRPASSTPTRSVKVPPTSTPMRSISASPAPRPAGHEAVDPIARARLRGPPGGRPVAAAPHRLHQEHRAGGNRHPDLLGLEHARLAARDHPVAMGQPVLAAQYPVGRVADAVARGVAERGLGRLHAQLEHRPHSSAEAPVARGVGPELVTLEEEREARLRDLHRAELDPACGLPLAGALPAVARRRRSAAAARVEEVPDELARVPRVRPRDRDADAPRPAGQPGTPATRVERLDH